jgi:elongator complex protein 3
MPNLNFIIKKPIRTLSGVTPVAVLTKPYPCPGKCLYCPNEPGMPKSYLKNEPGGQRAVANRFDPYRQVTTRLETYRVNNHPTDKVELIVLGGTWSAYPRQYQSWFIKRCFDALNNRSSKNLLQAQKINETAVSRCVGLSLETRPDWITAEELIRFRRLGCTKVQIGIQSLNDRILRLNRRGHTVSQTKKAIKLLRQFGFKIQAHWMANLYGAAPKSDLADFKKLFADLSIRPDELKIYPCSLIKSAPLYNFYQKKLWRPYSQPELINLLVKILPLVPQYCRVSRMIRDFAKQDIAAGNKQSNLRQLVEVKAKAKIKEIRWREIRNLKLTIKNLQLKIISYKTSVGREKFLQFVTLNDQVAALLRLSLPENKKDGAMIRELHVYGQSLRLGSKGKSQHLGLGKRLVEKAVLLSRGYPKLSVISAVGTREYYRRLGFKDGRLYQQLQLVNVRIQRI